MTTNNTNIIYRDLSYQIMGAIFEVHKELGPGSLEAVYEKALIEEFAKKAIKVETQRVIDGIYKGKKIGVHRLDMIVEGKVVVELKTMERFSIYPTTQMLPYLKASGHKLGILVNFSKAKVEYRRIVMG
ncbi:MAG TPA: GxxExxY protein [Thermodesulfobacteriota bacterium]|nr:GxxExxY protein [Thermodesulfobacteriota bacterium]